MLRELSKRKEKEKYKKNSETAGKKTGGPVLGWYRRVIMNTRNLNFDTKKRKKTSETFFAKNFVERYVLPLN